MSNFMTDLNGIYTTGLETVTKTAVHNTNSRLGQDLEMADFLNLMVESLKNQTIDNQMELGDMMNQMVQMSVMTAMTNISELITQSTNLSCAASLVGKEVTIGQKVGTQVNRIRGTVTGTGMVNGQQAIFVGDKSYWMSDILAVGRLPNEEYGADDEGVGGGDNVRRTGGTDGGSGGGAADGSYSGGGGIGGDYRVTGEAPAGT